MILKWFEAKANEKLRRSQLNMLFQNYLAYNFLNEYFQPMFQADPKQSAEAIENFSKFEDITAHAVLALMARTVLDDHRTQELSAVNTLLKSIYADVLEARSGLSAMGLNRGTMLPFADRFRPRAGWQSLGENEWSEMCDWAVAIARKRPPPF